MKKVLGITFLMLALVPAGWAQDKKLVAVLDFDYGTVRSAVQAYFGTDQDVGKGISLLLEQKLVQGPGIGSSTATPWIRSLKNRISLTATASILHPPPKSAAFWA